MGNPISFETLTDDILLRIGSYQADPATNDFLKKYVPFLAKRPQETGWTAYASFEETGPFSLTRHSLIFFKHPFLEIDFREGRLDVLTKESNNQVVGLQTYFITLAFDNKAKADIVFDFLCTSCEGVSNSKKIVTDGDKRIAFFQKNEEDGGQIQFVLTKDDLYNDRYKIILGQIIDLALEDYYGS